MIGAAAGIDEATTTPPALYLPNYRFTNDLTLIALEKFPFLLSIHIPQSLVLQFMEQLIKDGLGSQAIK